MSYAKALLLKQLYLRKLAGEVYCESLKIPSKRDWRFYQGQNLHKLVRECALCELHKSVKEKTLGHCCDEANITFITFMPVLENTTSFEMLQKIANNVFCMRSYCIFSLIKCNVYTAIKDSHIAACKEYLKMQLNAKPCTLNIIFGKDVAQCILGNDNVEDLRGRILESDFSHKHKKFIVTYGISDLIRNPSLKKYAWQDFKKAKDLLGEIQDV